MAYLCTTIYYSLLFLLQILESLEKSANGSIGNSRLNSSSSSGLRIKGFSLTWKVLRRNSIRPEEEIIEQILEGFKKESKPYMLNPKYSTPTSLPLYFYFGYQLFQESKCLEECGPVRNKFLVFIWLCI